LLYCYVSKCLYNLFWLTLNGYILSVVRYTNVDFVLVTNISRILNCIKNMVLISFWKTYRKITSIFEFLYIMNYDFPCAHYNGKEGAIYRQWWNMQSILTHFHEHINIDHGLWNYIALEFFHMKAIIVFCVNICRFTLYLFCGWVLAFKNHPNYVSFHSTLCFAAFIILYHLDKCAYSPYYYLISLIRVHILCSREKLCVYHNFSRI
jgi:hypothetical protein